MHISFRAKISLMVVVFSMAMTVLLSTGFYRMAGKNLQNTYRQTQTESLQRYAGQFDTIMRDAYNACIYAAENEQLIAAVDAGDDEAAFALLQRYRRETASADSVAVYDAPRRRLLRANQAGTAVVEDPTVLLPWMKQQETEQQTHPLSPVYAKDLTSVTEEPVFVYSKPLRSDETQGLGQVVVMVDERTIFFNCLQGRGSETNSYILSGDTIVSSANIYDLHKQPEWPETGMTIIDVGMPMSEYRIVSLARTSDVMADLAQTRNLILLIGAVLNLLFLLLIVWIVQRVMHPLEELHDCMKRVGEGDLQQRAVIYHDDEIGQLSEGFNHMIEQVEGLIGELVTEKMLKKEAEIEALQYQITPHFMYNTLNSIKYQAILQGSQDTAELLEAFIELLQLSASDRGAFITVEQEMRMVGNYVRLQQFRYADCFDVAFDVPEEAKDCYVPRLLVQPVVENAILHGIDHRKKDNHLQISVLINGPSLAIKVVDQGAGMTPEEIEKLLHGQKKSKFSGIGVSNIRERLQLYYADQGSLRFLSTPGEGTTAVITLPVSRDADEYTI